MFGVMVITYIALMVVFLSILLALSGVGVLARDTITAVNAIMGRGSSRVSMLAFLGLWLLIFGLALG